VKNTQLLEFSNTVLSDISRSHGCEY